MSAYLSKNLKFSLMEDEAAMVTAGKKQGIVSILGSDSERTKAASLRRTLSADMSSKKWLEQNGMPTMKRVASVLEFPVSSTTDSSSCFSSDEEEEERKGVQTHGSQLDIWTSIISQKAGEDSSKSEQLPPYIHPLVKRASSLSEKSLEICTESLGSETGSDGFSSYPSSETGDEEEEKEEEEEKQQVEQQEEKVVVTEEFRVAKYSCYYNKKSSSPRSFPPPLPSLSRGDGPSLRVQSHRENGRLVLEAVSVPSQKNFSAQRQDGRLLLTFVNNSTADHEPKDEEIDVNDENDIKEAFDELLGEFDEEEKVEVEVEEEEEVENGVEENIAKKMGIVMMEQAPKMKSEVMNVNRTALMMNKLIRLANRNPTWPKRINEVVKFEDVEEEDEVMELQPQSFPLPPHGRVARRLIPTSPTSVRANATFNTYDNFWRSKPTTTSVVFTPTNLQKSASFKNNNINNNNNNNNMVLFSKSGTPKANDNKQQQMLVMRGDKGDYLVPMMKNCKESRRSLLFWEPYCIATS